jgi:hypothetical protein
MWFSRPARAQTAIDGLKTSGRTVRAAALRDGSAPPPLRIVVAETGYGPEPWAVDGPELVFDKKDGTPRQARLILCDGDDPAALATALGVPFGQMSVRFR